MRYLSVHQVCTDIQEDMDNVFGGCFIVARYGMPHSPPLSFLATRYALSILCFLPWIVLAGVKWPTSRAQWFHLSVVGVLRHAG